MTTDAAKFLGIANNIDNLNPIEQDEMAKVI
jgi:hypothetical protein